MRRFQFDIKVDETKKLITIDNLVKLKFYASDQKIKVSWTASYLSDQLSNKIIMIIYETTQEAHYNNL